jgi:S-adenosylmethionine-diacylglycerol 3-amino-3-carboxypropyl transferase
VYRLLYSNCWEDAKVVTQALNIKSDNTYLSIASAGDNSLVMLANAPRFVLAVDKNPAQIACLDLKRAAIEHLSYSDTLAFLGITDSNSRLPIYRRIRNALSRFARRFWDTRPADIEHGVIHAGITERNFKRFRQLVLPLAISIRDRQQLLSDLPAVARRQLCDAVCSRLRFRYSMRTVFSRAMIAQFKIGAYSTFYHAENGTLAKTIVERVRQGLCAPGAHDNPFLTYIMTGSYGHTLPYYLKKQIFHRIKENINALRLFPGTILQALDRYRTHQFDGFNLSDIFEYMDRTEFHACVQQLLARASTGARLVYWNTLQSRDASQCFGDRLKTVDDLADILFQKNKSFFYDSLVINEVC